MKRSGFWFQTWKFQKPSEKLHFGVTKKDAGLPFHFHVLNLFKCWLNLGFDQDQMGKKKSKKSKKWKLKHIVFLCHIVSIQFDKQGLNIFKPDKSCIYPLTLNSVLWSRSSMKRSGFGFQTWKFQKPPKSFILELLRRIHAYLLFSCFKHVQILVKPYLGFDQDSNGYKNSKKLKNQST